MNAGGALGIDVNIHARINVAKLLLFDTHVSDAAPHLSFFQAGA